MLFLLYLLRQQKKLQKNMPKNYSVFFFQNGLTAVTDTKEQVPELQKSWLLLYVKFLESKGFNPEEFEFNLPTGEKAYLLKTPEGSWTWRSSH